MNQKFKRMISVLLMIAMILPLLPCIPVIAESEVEKYPYTLFASSKQEGAITIHASSFSVNGNIATNGTVSCDGQLNLNGTKTEHAEKDRMYLFEKLDTGYFSGDDVSTYEETFTIDEMNYSINKPVEVLGKAEIEGNTYLNSPFKAMQDITIQGETFNTNNAVLYSKYGDISITNQNVSLNGLVYAPFGDVKITAQNLNLNQVVIIADTITLECPNMNANYNSDMGIFVGNVSEELNISEDEYKYLQDTDGDGLQDIMEEEIGSDPCNADTDGDGLPDGYEVNSTGTDPTMMDTDKNGILDSDEDLDCDRLTNMQEYQLGTFPGCNDSDDDGLLDGDESNTYKTNPLLADTDSDGLEDADEIALGTDPTLPDTDGNGVMDCDEKFMQTYRYEVPEENCAISEVSISMSATGNLNTCTEIESVMGKDIASSNVAGLIGEPFEITTDSEFDEAVLSFQVDKDKLNDTEFTDLIFLWYDEANQEYKMLDTTYDEENSTVSTTVTHFSRYMIVDKVQWFEAWNKELNYTSTSYEKSICYSVLAVDCSGSMYSNDPVTVIAPASGSYQSVNDCGRYQACSNFIQTMDSDDKAAVVTFESSAKTVCELTNDKSILTAAASKFYNGGGTSFDAALRESIDLLKSSSGGTRLKIILLTDGESSVSSSILQEAKDAYITIYTIGLGNSSDSILENIADETGGEFFKAYTANELQAIYAQIGLQPDYDKTDTDGDGLADILETTGMRLSNGTIIYTDPNLADTDGDGLLDGEEINPTLRYCKQDFGAFAMSGVTAYYFSINSDPRYKDSDGDSYLDYDEVKTYKSNPYKNEVKFYRWNKGYFNVDYSGDANDKWKKGDISYGGAQRWFFNDKNTKWYSKYTNDYKLESWGCGLVSASDILLYLSQNNKNYTTMQTNIVNLNNSGNVNYQSYMNYLYNMSETYFKVCPVLGVLGTNIAQGVNHYSSDNDLGMSATWCVSKKKMLPRIKEMLNNDIPVTFSIGPCTSKKGIYFYDWNPTTNDMYNFKTIQKKDTVDGHYVTITGLMIDKVKNQTILEISSWGTKYYVNYEEYTNIVDTYSNYVFSNIVYIKR